MSMFQSGDIRDQFARLSEIALTFFMLLGRQFFFWGGGGTAKFLTYICKSGSPSNIVAKFGDDRLSDLRD